MRQCARCKTKRPLEAFGPWKTCGKCREYSRVNRHRWPSRRDERIPKPWEGKPAAVVLGRRHCKDCKRWRHIHDFRVATWLNNKRETALTFSVYCRHCERIRGRVRNARRAGRDKPYGPRRKGQSREERNRRWSERHKFRMKTDPEYARDYREYQRIWAEGKRRKQRIKPNSFANRSSLSRREPVVSVEPLKEWLLDEYLRYMQIAEIARAANMDDARLAGLLNGRVQGGNLTIGSVDKITTGLGRPEMTSILYPDV